MTRSTEAGESGGRSVAIDALRGFLMIAMALDHAVHFVSQKHSSGEYWGGPFPSYHAAIPFLTRWITHLCAPGFFFLMGAGMALFAASRARAGFPRLGVLAHFAVRGSMLVALELTLVAWAWRLSPGGWNLGVYVGVLFGLGAVMILTGALAYLPPAILAALACLLALASEAAMPSPDSWATAYSPIVRALLIPGGDASVWVQYPAVPWLGATILGMAFGRLLERDRARAYKAAALTGIVLLIAFATIRGLDGFGNLRPRQGGSWIAWLNAVKYPPSIAFLCMTLGVDLLLLSLFGRLESVRPAARISGILSRLGREPLFFYVCHLYVYAGIGWLIAPRGAPLGTAYVAWLAGLAILYPLCRVYGRIKRRLRRAPLPSA